MIYVSSGKEEKIITIAGYALGGASDLGDPSQVEQADRDAEGRHDLGPLPAQPVFWSSSTQFDALGELGPRGCQKLGQVADIGSCRKAPAQVRPAGKVPDNCPLCIRERGPCSHLTDGRGQRP
jgi:hypothetical protein